VATKKTVALTSFAHQVRAGVLQSIEAAGSGHLAGSLGVIEVLTYFYRQVLRHHPDDPEWAERDLFFLSAGHLCPAWYSILATSGYFDSELLLTLRQLDSPLQGHPQRHVAFGIENSAGPLGQGVSQAVGAAYGLKQAESERQVFCLSSDGEQNEGQVWEAYLFAAHYQLANFTLLLDVNGIQQSGPTTEVLDTSDLKAKFLAFNFAVGVCDGNDFQSIAEAWQKLASAPYPKVLLCQTEPGYGVPFLANDYHWHAAVPTPTEWAEIWQTWAAVGNDASPSKVRETKV
jgi:transketolase